MDIYAVKSYLNEYYDLSGELIPQVGFTDINYKLVTATSSFLVKISLLENTQSYLDYQDYLLIHLQKDAIPFSRLVHTLFKKPFINLELEDKKYRLRVLEWVEGKPWAALKNKHSSLYAELGRKLAEIDKSLSTSSHPHSKREFKWDNNQGLWIMNHIHLFSTDEMKIIAEDISQLEDTIDKVGRLRHQIIHNDGNDYNIIVKNSKVVSLIDIGDAIYTSLINELSISLAYVLMREDDCLTAAGIVVKYYHECFPLEKAEIELLYQLIRLRLLISLTTSKINLKEDPENEYLQISARPAWELLSSLNTLGQDLFTDYILTSCGFVINADLIEHLQKHKISLNKLLEGKFMPTPIDLHLGSKLLGLPEDFNQPDRFQRILDEYLLSKNSDLAYGGYLECRPFYITDAFKEFSVDGFSHRTFHLGEDYWAAAGTGVKAVFDGEVVVSKINDIHKDYGGTLILRHISDSGHDFYVLYGHLSTKSISQSPCGKKVKAGDIIGWLGHSSENGDWAPHLHFQVITKMYAHQDNFPGVSRPDQVHFWSQVCPSPQLLVNLSAYHPPDYNLLQNERNKFISQSLSVSYAQPLTMLRGDGIYLINEKGQKYMDLVNNVAHVGHENGRVVKAALRQISTLNTNSRYLHPSINEYAQQLLELFPEKYQKVFFVNSGSEANELAIRMSKVVTNRKKMAALEHGYHGNTNATIDISHYKFAGKGGCGTSDAYIFPSPMKFRNMFMGKSFRLGHIEEFDFRQIAGFIHETILSCGGQLILPEGYLQEIYNLIKNAGGLAIADEIQTGFGRVGKAMWAFQLEKLDPDIVTLGKPIGNGHPIGALVTTNKIADAFNNGMEFFSTFGGNPVSCEIGKAVIAEIKDHDLKEHASAMGDYFKQGLEQINSKYGKIGEVRGEGLFIGFEFYGKEGPNPILAKNVVEACKNLRILLSTDGPDNNVIKIKPPLVIQRNEIDYVIESMDKVLADLT